MSKDSKICLKGHRNEVHLPRMFTSRFYFFASTQQEAGVYPWISWMSHVRFQQLERGEACFFLLSWRYQARTINTVLLHHFFFEVDAYIIWHWNLVLPLLPPLPAPLHFVVYRTFTRELLLFASVASPEDYFISSTLHNNKPQVNEMDHTSSTRTQWKSQHIAALLHSTHSTRMRHSSIRGWHNYRNHKLTADPRVCQTILDALLILWRANLLTIK